MIDKNSMIHLTTDDAKFALCRVMAMSKTHLTVSYFAGMKKDKETGEMYEDHQITTVERKRVRYIGERL